MKFVPGDAETHSRVNLLMTVEPAELVPMLLENGAAIDPATQAVLINLCRRIARLEHKVESLENNTPIVP